eukprot:768386-Hanusia_phi.AAC.1
MRGAGQGRRTCCRTEEILGTRNRRSRSSLTEEARATPLTVAQGDVCRFPSCTDRRDPAAPAVRMRQDPGAGDFPHRLVQGCVGSSRPPARVHELVHLLVEEVHPCDQEVDVAVDSRELPPAVAPGVDVGESRLVDILVVLELVAVRESQHDRHLLVKAAKIVVGVVPTEEVISPFDHVIVLPVRRWAAVSHLYNGNGEVEEESKLHVDVDIVLSNERDTLGEIAKHSARGGKPNLIVHAVYLSVARLCNVIVSFTEVLISSFVLIAALLDVIDWNSGQQQLQTVEEFCWLEVLGIVIAIIIESEGLGCALVYCALP